MNLFKVKSRLFLSIFAAMLCLFLVFGSVKNSSAYYGLGGMYGGLYGMGLYGGLYGGGLYGMGLYGGLYGMGLYGGLYGMGLYGGLYGGGLYGRRLYGGLYGMGLYGGLYGMGLYGGLYGGGLGGLGGLTSLLGSLGGTTTTTAVAAEQAGFWDGYWFSYLKLTSGPMNLNLVEDPVTGELSGTSLMVLNKYVPAPVDVSGIDAGTGTFLLKGTFLDPTSLISYTVELTCTLTSSTSMTGDYFIYDIFYNKTEFGEFTLNLTTPVVSAPVVVPTVVAPTVVAPTVVAPTVVAPTVVAPTVVAPTVVAPTVVAPTIAAPTAATAVVPAVTSGLLFGYIL